MSQRASPDQIAAALQQGYFADDQPLPTPDPRTVMLIELTLDDIDFYDRNPRVAHNAQYDEIKASIRTRGVDTPLPVTRRPDGDRFIIGKGGNTRLAILKELFEETGDPRYHRIRCHFTPWISELDTLVAHLAENDQRGNLIFIDRARAVHTLKGLIEAEATDDEPLSRQDFSARLKALGYAQHPSTLSLMDYAVQTLEPSIPQALNADMGRPQVEQLRKLDTAARALWERFGVDECFSPTWETLLRRRDGDDFDIAKLKSNLEREIAVATDGEEYEIARALEHQLHPARSTPSMAADVAGAAPSETVSVLGTGASGVGEFHNGSAVPKNDAEIGPSTQRHGKMLTVWACNSFQTTCNAEQYRETVVRRANVVREAIATARGATTEEMIETVYNALTNQGGLFVTTIDLYPTVFAEIGHLMMPAAHPSDQSHQS